MPEKLAGKNHPAAFNKQIKDETIDYLI